MTVAEEGKVKELVQPQPPRGPSTAVPPPPQRGLSRPQVQSHELWAKRATGAFVKRG